MEERGSGRLNEGPAIKDLRDRGGSTMMMFCFCLFFFCAEHISLTDPKTRKVGVLPSNKYIATAQGTRPHRGPR